MFKKTNNNYIPTVEDALNYIAYKFWEGGEHGLGSGSSEAAPSALIACANFQEYLDNFPEDIKEKILALPVGVGLDRNETLGKILGKLSANTCVECSAGTFTNIISSNEKNPLLSAKPNVMDGKIGEANFCLISLYLHRKRENIDRINKYLIPLSPKQRFEFLREKTHRQDTILHLILADIASIKAISKLINADQLLELVLQKNQQGYNFLQMLAFSKSYDCLKFIFSQFSANNALRAIKGDGNSLLHHLIHSGDVAGLTLVLSFLSTKEKKEAINLKDHQNKSVLDLAEAHPNAEILEILTKGFPRGENLRIKEEMKVEKPVDKKQTQWVMPKINKTEQINKLKAFKNAYNKQYQSEFFKNPFSTMKKTMDSFKTFKQVERYAEKHPKSRTATVLKKLR